MQKQKSTLRSVIIFVELHYDVEATRLKQTVADWSIKQKCQNRFSLGRAGLSTEQLTEHSVYYWESQQHQQSTVHSGSKLLKKYTLEFIHVFFLFLNQDFLKKI